MHWVNSMLRSKDLPQGSRLIRLIVHALIVGRNAGKAVASMPAARGESALDRGQ